MLAIFYFNAVIHIWDVKWARSLSNLTFNILSLRRTQVNPLKPNLIELGRYRKIDRESVTWLRRVWTQGMAGFAKREGNQMNFKRKFKGAGVGDLIHMNTSSGFEMPLHFFCTFYHDIEWLLQVVSTPYSLTCEVESQSACFKGNNSRMKLLVLQISNDFNCRSWNYVIAGNYLTALLSWLWCRSFPMIQLILTL